MSKNYKARWVKRPSGPKPENKIAEGIFRETFERKSLIRKNFSFSAGEKVSFAELAITADGGHGRIFRTDCWVPLNVVSDLQVLEVSHSNFLEQQSKFLKEYSLKRESGSATLISVGADENSPQTNKTKIKQKTLHRSCCKKENYMDKKELKTLIADLGKTHIGEEIEITFRATSKATSGRYRLLEVKRGRGKGGSMIARVESVSNGHTMSFGTPNNEELMNIRWNDNGEQKLVGFADESSIPLTFNQDAEIAQSLKTSFTALIGQKDVSVEVDASEASFQGTFKLLEVKKMAGRFGQVRLNLEREDGSNFEIWSYRHSGIVKSVKIV